MKRMLSRVNKVAIVEAAMAAAYIDDASFTTIALAARLKMPPNRHFRVYLNSLAQATDTRPALLATQRVLGEDGHYRKYFFAQVTKPMFKFKEKAA